MNQAMRWKRFIEWWDGIDRRLLYGMTADGFYRAVQEKLDDLRKPEETSGH